MGLNCKGIINMHDEKFGYFLKMSLINTIIFVAVYFILNNLSIDRDLHPVYFDWEIEVPLISWAIIPYISFNLLIILPYTLLTKYEIKHLSLAFMTCTIVAGIIFALTPGELGFKRVIPNDMFGSFYAQLFILDRPYNLFPSLHVAYTTLFYIICKNKIKHQALKALLLFWISLVIMSTILTHQHHLFDVITGILLALTAYQYWAWNMLISKKNHLLYKQ